MDKLRWGVIGAGGIADRRTIPGMLLADNAQLMAVMEINQDFAEKLRLKYGAKYAYDDEEKLLDNQEVDAVYIASPVQMHIAQAKMAADRGKHILCEKPIGMTSAEGWELCRYCASKGVKIGAGFMMRFGTHIMNMKRFIAEGKIGQVVSGYSQLTLWLPGDAGNWRTDKERSGGGCMMDMAVHLIDLVEYVTGMRITKVASLNETITFNYDVEDISSMILRLENGAQCIIQTNFNIPDEAAKWRFEIFGTRGRLLGDTIIGQNDGGKLHALFLEGHLVYDPKQDHNDSLGKEISSDFGNMYTREIESFSNSVLLNRPLEVPATDAVHVQDIMEKAYRSSLESKIFNL